MTSSVTVSTSHVGSLLCILHYDISANNGLQCINLHHSILLSTCTFRLRNKKVGLYRNYKDSPISFGH